MQYCFNYSAKINKMIEREIWNSMTKFETNYKVNKIKQLMFLKQSNSPYLKFYWQINQIIKFKFQDYSM